MLVETSQENLRKDFATYVQKRETTVVRAFRLVVFSLVDGYHFCPLPVRRYVTLLPACQAMF